MTAAETGVARGMAGVAGGLSAPRTPRGYFGREEGAMPPEEAPCGRC